MTSYYIEMTLETGGVAEQDRKGFEQHLDDVAEAFSDISDVDGDVGADLAAGRIELCMTLSADSRLDALTKAVTAARTAIHAAGGGTPGWENMLTKLLDDDEYLLNSAPSAWASRAHCPA
jgi:hypothetical protein